MSDGGEDPGAEEALWGIEVGEESACQFWEEPSRASGSSFRAVVLLVKHGTSAHKVESECTKSQLFQCVFDSFTSSKQGA